MNHAAAATGAAMIREAGPLLADLRASMARDAYGAPPRCFPYVAGIAECGELPKESAPSNRDSEPWRTYAETLYSGAIDDNITAELLEWHQTKQGNGVAGSRLKMGILSGCGGDVHCGDQFETFTIHGWGYGLLKADLYVCLRTFMHVSAQPCLCSYLPHKY